MTLFDKLTKEELKELIIKNWMTHDGMWFYHCVREFGVEKANQLNKSAIGSLAVIEVGRIKKFLGSSFDTITEFDQLVTFIDNAYSVAKGDFMDFDYSFPAKNIFHWKMKKCFAYEGMKRIGVEKQYECGLMHRVKAWLDQVGVKYEMKPDIMGCLKNTQSECCGDYIFKLT